MPAGVMMGKDGSLLSIGANAVLGSFRTCELRVRQDRVDTSGPMDDFEYGRLRRMGASITIDRFILADAIVAPCPPSVAGSAMSMVVPAAGWACGDLIPGTQLYNFQCDLLDGSTFSAQVHITEVGGSVSDDPNTESMTLETYGPIAFG